MSNLELNKIHNIDCLEFMKTLPDKCIDLIVTDPPYLIENTQAGGGSNLSKSIQKMNTELEEAENLTEGIRDEYFIEMERIMKDINIYIWCNHKQIPQYLDIFYKKFGCKFDIIVWNKVNAMPLFNNKYLTDKEYCLYFRKGGYCNPKNYDSAKTCYYQPINSEDKKVLEHPTIKPLNIIYNLVENSSKENEIVFDPFIGSGTTAVACKMLKRNYIGCEISKEYCDIAEQRIKAISNTLF